MISRLFNRVLRIDRWTRTRFTPLGRMLLASLIGVGLFALNPRATLAYQLAVMVLAVVVASVLWAPLFRPRLRLRRSLPRYATVDMPLRYSLELINQGVRALDDLYLRDEPRHVEPTAALAQARAELATGRGMFRPRVGYMRFMRTMRRMEGARCSGAHVELAPPGQPVQVPMELVPLRRGYLYLDDVQVTRTDPLGVFRALERLRHRDRVLGCPGATR